MKCAVIQYSEFVELISVEFFPILCVIFELKFKRYVLIKRNVAGMVPIERCYGTVIL
jgi:hypothetical protein